MSATTTATEHGHGGPGQDHVPHVLPLAAYLAVFGALLVLTVVTVAGSYVDLGHTWNLVMALVIASTKASLVGLVFMHLAFDKKFNAIVFLSSILFLAIFIAFTMFDTEYRDLSGRRTQDKPADVTNPFGGTEADAAMRAKWGAPAGGAEGAKAPAPAHH